MVCDQSLTAMGPYLTSAASVSPTNPLYMHEVNVFLVDVYQPAP